MLLRNLSEVYKKGLRFMSDLYNRIEILCKEKKISITTMCKESGASRASLSDLKVGRKQSLSADTLSKIAHYFSVSVDFLLTGKASYKPTQSSDEDNPWEIELLDAFDELDLGKQIEAVAHVQNLANGTETKKAPAEIGKRSASDELKFALWGSCEDISDEDLADVLRYAAFVRERKKDKL